MAPKVNFKLNGNRFVIFTMRHLYKFYYLIIHIMTFEFLNSLVCATLYFVFMPCVVVVVTLHFVNEDCMRHFWHIKVLLGLLAHDSFTLWSFY